MQEQLWIAVGAMMALAVIAGLGEARRRRRKDFDRVGFMPWAMIQVLALLLAVVLASVAMH